MNWHLKTSVSSLNVKMITGEKYEKPQHDIFGLVLIYHSFQMFVFSYRIENLQVMFLANAFPSCIVPLQYLQLHAETASQ